MTDWRIPLVAGVSVVVILVSLLVLALPDNYEGEIVYTIDAAHTIRALDVAGLALLMTGGGAAWVAGVLWMKKVAI